MRHLFVLLVSVCLFGCNENSEVIQRDATHASVATPSVHLEKSVFVYRNPNGSINTEVHVDPMNSIQAKVTQIQKSSDSRYPDNTWEYVLTFKGEKNVNGNEVARNQDYEVCRAFYYDSKKEILYLDSGGDRDASGCPAQLNFGRPFERVL